jgi:hypothetical protein
MDNRFDRIDERLDKTNEILARNTATLEEHVRRTNLLEQKVAPIEAHVHMMNVLAKVASVAMAAALAAKSLGLF